MQIPMKGKYTRQVNIKITEETYQEICLLRAGGADIGDLFRPGLEKTSHAAAKQMRKKLEEQAAS